VGLALGAADYITKPINLGIARQRIGNLLEREQLRKEVEAQRDHLEQLVAELHCAAAGLEDEVAERTADLRAMAKELLAAEARERSAISIDLHDDLGQDLAIAKLKLGALVIPGEGPAREFVLHDLKEVEALLDRCNKSVRSLSSQLCPPVLHQYGLGAALEWLSLEIRRIYGLNVRLHLGNPVTLDETTAATLYRIVRELLINISKHAQVSEAEVTMSMDAETGNLEISVADDGVGFDVAQTLQSKPLTHSSYGLFSIKQRIDFLGGRMWIDSHADHGTIVLITLAVAPAEPKILTERSAP
ncbi:MAG: hypothetical protein D4S02_15200, partial [Rhodocyclaceae bacterium]